jgi:hypothetical protein
MMVHDHHDVDDDALASSLANAATPLQRRLGYGERIARLFALEKHSAPSADSVGARRTFDWRRGF